MLQEKPDNAAPWRQRLEQLENLPEEHLSDKTQLWEKLHDRLQQAPRSTRMNWSWLAAACLLLIFLLPLMRINKKQAIVVKSNIVETQQKAGKPTQPVVTHTAPTIQPKVARKLLDKSYSQLKNPRHIIKPANPGSTAGIKHGVPTVLPDTPGFVVPLNRDIVVMASSQPEKKKLRVVHINELEQPLLENIQSGSKHATAAFQKQRARQFQASGFEFSTNSSEEILKIKLPSN